MYVFEDSHLVAPGYVDDDGRVPESGFPIFFVSLRIVTRSGSGRRFCSSESVRCLQCLCLDEAIFTSLLQPLFMFDFPKSHQVA